MKRKETAKNLLNLLQTVAAAARRPQELSPAHCTLTYVGSAQSFAQRPRPDVRRLAVDGQTLNAADEAAVGSRGPDQPVGAGGSAHVQRGSEGDLAVLALENVERRLCLKTPFSASATAGAIRPSPSGPSVQSPVSVLTRACRCPSAASRSFRP